MKSNQIMLYNTSIDEALEMFDMESRRDPEGYIDLEPYQIKLNKKGDHVLVTLERALRSGLRVEDGIVALKIEYPHKWRDFDMLERVKAVRALNPSSSFWNDKVMELNEGEPLSWKVVEILEEVEERIQNPDQETLDLLNQALAAQPSNSFLQSLKSQFMGGRELSEKQLEALKRFAPAPSVGGSSNYQLTRIEEALRLDPRNRFLQDLEERASRGINLSSRQMDVVEEIIGSQSSPAAKLLNDLKQNAYLEREDFMIIQKGQRRGIDALNEEERKRLRHLIYRNERKLTHSYSKEDVRTLLKKGSVDVLRDLEIRIARLEGLRRR